MSQDHEETEKEALKTLMAKAELVAMQPVGFLARVEARPPDEAEPVSISVTAEVDLSLSDEGFSSMLRLTVTAKREGTEEQPFARFLYNILARYTAPRALCQDDAVRLAYAEYVGLLQAWPYARSFIQSSCAQLGVPIILLPTIRAGSIKLQLRPHAATPAAAEKATPEGSPPSVA